MTDIVTGDVVRAVFSWLLDNQTVVQQVWHYVKNSGTAEDAGDFMDDLEVHHETIYALGLDDLIPDDLVATAIEIYLWNTTTKLFDGVATGTHDQTGLSTGQWGAPGVCYLVNLLTDVGRYQGRKYVAGVIENSIADGVILSSSAATVGVWAVAQALPWSSTDGNYTAGVFNEAAERFTQFNGNVVASTNPAYQRRRRAGVGI